MTRLLDYFFLTRPILVFVCLVFPLAGARPLDESSPRLWLLLLQYFCIIGSGFIINQLVDREGDQANQKCESLARGYVRVREARILAWVLAVVGLLLAGLLGWWNLAGTAGFFLLTGVCYSLPPCKAKDRPLLAPLVAVPAMLILILQGAGLNGPLALAPALWRGVPLALAGVAISLLATVPDLPGDRASGKRTLAVAYGAPATWVTSLCLMGSAAILALSGRDWEIGAPALLSTCLMAWGLREQDGAAASWVLRWSLALLALALAARWRVLALLLLLFLVAARVYYQKRFHITYPSLGRERT